MHHRLLALLVISALGVVAFLAPVANSASKSISMVGAQTFSKNRYLNNTLRFRQDSVTVSPNSTLSIVDKTNTPHTFSLAKKSQLPNSLNSSNLCFYSGPCKGMAKGHGLLVEGEPPSALVLNAGAGGFNQPGDSIYINGGQTAKVKITASRGKNLYALCLMHPWMQIKVAVR